MKKWSLTLLFRFIRTLHFLFLIKLNAISSIDVIVFRFKWAESAQNRLGIRYLRGLSTSQHVYPAHALIS